MAFYKVVNDALRSATVDDGFNKGLSVQYKEGESVSADPELAKLGWGLFVFTDFDSAFKFANGLGRCLYECEVDEALPIQHQLVGNVFTVNKHQLLTNSDVLLCQTPSERTLIVRSVKLTRLITCFY